MAARRYRLGLAVSGGADSVALLLLLAAARETLPFDAAVLHVDHGLRPDSADDARFVRRLAAAHNLPFHMTRLHLVRQRGESVEMAARRERLAFFARMTRRLHLDAVATGHHADDVAETFLLRLARGAGPQGLSGLRRLSRLVIPPDNLPLTFIRPLLDLRDAQLRDYLRACGQTWREDSTNADLSIPRNNVRHLVLPWLREHFDPRITEHLCKSAAILRGDLTPPARPGPEHGADCGRLFPDAVPYRLTISESTGFSRAPQKIGRLPATCSLSRAALRGQTLEMRPWQPGDRIAPTGMNGCSRKIQDVFVTAKVAPAVRATLPILARAGTSEVLWVPGYRVAESVAVESSTAPSFTFSLEVR